MKKKCLLPSMLLTAVVVGGAASSVQAAAISINYEVNPSSTPPLAALEVAGVVPSANWNNIVNGDHSVTIGDDSGVATSMGISLSSAGLESWNRGITDPSNGRVFSDKMSMGGTGSINLTTVPYAVYDVYVYLSDWGSEVVNFSIDGGTTTLATLTNVTNGFDGVYVENDNYVILSGLSGSSTSITMTATSGAVHLGGFQVVQVPEPAAALLGGLGLLGLLRRRRA